MTKQRESGITWTEETWNPVRGCSRVSKGCMNCYAEGVANRFKGPGMPYEGLIASTGQWNGTVKTVDSMMYQPLRWKRPRLIFVNSMSDLFHESLEDKTIDRIFAVMALSGQHTYQILTKRAQRMSEYLRDFSFDRMVENCKGEDGVSAIPRYSIATLQLLFGIRKWPNYRERLLNTWPLPNVWLGVSVEDQATADERIPYLLDTPAAVCWVSAEPLLGAVDLTPWIGGHIGVTGYRVDPYPHWIDWVVVGGESGAGARPMLPEWARSLRDQCVAAGVPYHFKQFGEYGTRASVDDVPVFRQFTSHQHWVNKASTWVQDGICLDSDGRQLKNGGDMMRARDEGKFPVTIMHKVGKKNAGRLLDGRTWDEYPQGYSRSTTNVEQQL